MPDPRQKLYKALSSNFDLGSQEEFNAKMDNPESRKKLYSAVSKSFDLGSFEEFEGKVSSLKKKDSSIAPEQKSASVPKTGSLDGKGTTQGFPEIDTNSVAPGMGVQASDIIEQKKAKSDKVKALEGSFYEATKNNDDDAVAEQRTQDAINKTGVWNTIKDVSKKSLNTVIDFASATSPTALGLQRLKVNEDPLATEKEQVRRESLKNKEKLSDLEVNSRATAIYKQKEKDNLFIDRANSFLDNLDPKDKELLRQDRALKATHLQENNAKKLKVVSAMQTVANEKIKEYQAIEKQLKDLKEKKQSFPEDLFKKYTALGTEIKNIGSSVNQYQNEILENKSDLGTAQEEFDLFSREYGDIKNFVGNLSASAKELGNGLLGGYLWFGDTVAGLAGKHQDKDYNEAINIATKNVADNSESIKKDREQLRKPVESIESVEGFVNYASDLMANQIPNLVVTSTGAKGLALIGTVSAGQKFSEMNTEVRQGKAKYSAAQMAFAPLLYGSAEVVSELPTLSILKKGGRVLESIAKNETELLAKTAKQKAVEWAKDYGVDMTKEMSGEQFTNFAQNFNDKYVLGKKEVGLLDNTGQVFKDTFTLTSMLKAAPHVFGVVVKPFQSKSDLGILDENSKKIIAFSQQLETEGLSDTEKTVIQKQIDKATTESATIMKNTVGKIKDTPSQLYDEVVSLNKQAGEIKSQARIINDGNLANKEALLKGLSEDYKALQEKRNGIIDGKTTVVDVLPLQEQETLKKQAMEALVTELNPDGTKDITITNEQVVERANKIYKENEQNSPASEAQPQAEVPQQAEAEALKDVESTTKALNDLLVPDKKDSSLMVDSQQTKDLYKLVKNSTLQAIKKTFKDGINFTTIDLISEAYHRAKADGNNPELVKAVEDVIGKPKESPKPQEVPPVEEKSTPDTKEPVAEASPVPSVSENKPKETKIIVHATADSKGFALNYNEGISSEDVSKANDPRSHQDRDIQVELNKGNSVIDKQATNKDGDNEISIIAPMTDFIGRSGGSVYDFTIDKNNNSTAERIKDIIEKNHKFSDKKGNELIKETVGLVKEYISTNEAAPPTNTPADGNLQPGDNPKAAPEQNNEVQPTAKSPTNKGEVGAKLIEVNKRVFGLDDEKSNANAIVMEKTIETMAERAGISKEEMFDKIDFEKGDAKTAENLSKKGKALFQIIGKNANLSKNVKQFLSDAKALDKKGTDSKAIFMQTGWEKGADGKWKYDMQEGKVEFKQTENGNLEDVLDYPELFDKYPAARKIKIVFNNNMPYSGLFVADKNRIQINNSNGPAESRLTILHEVQHWIQNKEGFSTGGNEATVKSFINDQIKNATDSKVKKAINAFKDLISKKKPDNAKVNQQLTKLKELLNKDDFALYESIAGEVEARNVEARFNMPIEQRKTTPLSETEDVSRDEQVVLFQGEQGAMLAEDGKFIIYALTDPNVSTPLHEMAHVYEHYLTDAERTAILENAGHETWSRDTSEHFARGFEKYLADGVAPNPEMKTIFENFKKWMAEIYNDITASAIDIKISPKMQTVFDAMLGNEKLGSKTSNTGIGTTNYKNKSAQIEGRKREITIGNGTKIKGQYKVVSADDILASHNEGNFSKTNGYPTNERGETINDRNYETDKNSQSEVIKIAQNFDGRAIQQTPVVTKDGIVVDGNNRVMSRKLSAKKGTDTQYKETLLEEAEMYGIDPNEISGISNPVLVFEAENNLPYNTETLAMFNKQDKKEKSNAGRAVEYSKTLSDKAKRQIAEIYDEADRPSDVTGDPKLVKKLRDILINNSIIETNEVPRYFDVDKGVMTKEGVVLMENIALGSVFNENTIQTLSLPGMGDIKNKILQSLVGLINNSSLHPEFSLSSELSNAVEVIYQLKTTKQTIEEYLDQPDLFGEKLTPNLDEYAVLLAMSDAGFKNWLKNYNNNIGQPDLFKTEGDPITTKRDITNETARTKRKQIPENLRSDAKGNAGENGQPNGKIAGEVQNEPNDKKDDGEIEHASTHDRTTALLSERVPHAKIKPVNSPKKLTEIIKTVSNGLKATLIYGRSGRRNSAGSYNPRNTLVRISRAGDIDTVAHELGHLLDDRHDILGTIPSNDQLAILQQLKWYSERGGSNPPAGVSAAKKAEYLEREGLAEFIRSYVANPEQTKIIAPELLAHFENTVDAKTKEVLKQFSTDFLDFANASGIEKTLANVEDIDLPNKTKFIEWVKSFRKSDDKLAFTKMDKFYAEMANSNHFGIKAFKALVGLNGKTDIKSHENFEIMSRVFLGINGKLENIFATGLINAKNEKLKAEGGTFSKNENGRTVYKDGTAMTVKWLIDGLDTTTDASLKQEMNEVIAMAVAERTIEYAKKFGRTTNLTGIGASIESDLSTAVDTMADFSEMKKNDPDKYNRIQEGVKRYRQMADSTLRYAVDKGRISEEQYAKIKEGNEFYVALNRNMELEPGEDLFSAFNTGTNGIGATKEIIKKAKGGTATIENPYLSLLRNMNNIIKEADRNEVMLSFVEPLKSTRQMGEGEPINYAQIGRLANDGDKNTIKVFVDGKLEKWQFQDDIFNSLKNIESISSNPIMSLLAKPSQLVRWTVTNNPVFYARNIVKDTQARLVVSNNHSTIKDMFHNAGDKELFELFGGSQAGHLHTSKESYSKSMTAAAKEIVKKGGIVIDFRKFGEKYAKFLQTGENLNRIAEFNRSYKTGKNQGMSDYDAGLYAAFEARDLMDFAVAGHTMREINKIVVFSNAGVQSLRKARKALLKDPAGFAFRTMLYSVLPTLAFTILRNAMGDDEEYEELPANQRDMFFNFKTAATGDAWISIPKPYELGLASAFVDRASSKLRGHDEAFDGVGGTTLKTLMPFDESSFLGGLKPLIEARMNRDTYTGRSIVPEYESGKLLELRKGVNKASFLGQNMSKMFKKAGMSVDPRNIDHIMKGYGTYFATQGMAVTDLMKKDRSEVNFWISKSGFAKDVPTYNAKSVKKTTELAVELGKINNSKMKSLRGKIEEFYLENNLQKRKVILKEIYLKSEKTYKKLQEDKVKMLKKSEEVTDDE